MFDLSALQYVVLLASAFLVGFSKTTGASLSTIIIPIMTDVFPAKEATGILAIAFFIGSFHAVYHYRHHVRWEYFLPLMPWSIVGLGLGAVYMNYANNDEVKLVIGLIILGMLLLNMTANYTVHLFKSERRSRTFAAVCGLLMGFSSTVANAGSPILAIYMLIQRENKTGIIATLAVFFLLSDLIKLPLTYYSGIITMECIQLNSLMLPCMLIGGFMGIAFVKWISENRFRRLVEVLAFFGCFKLIWRPLLSLI